MINIIYKIFSKLNKLTYLLKKRVYLIHDIIAKYPAGKIIIVSPPVHSNLGDQAQTYCILKWLDKNYKHRKIVLLEYFNNNFSKIILWLLNRNVSDKDIFLGHSGYLMVDHHLGWRDFILIAENFPYNKLIIFPQTINFTNEVIKKNISKVFNNHRDLTLMCRDEVSFEKAKKMFYNCNLILYPDIVTSLIGEFNYTSHRDGILILKRHDKESFFDNSEIKYLEEKLVHKNYNVSIEDTSIRFPFSKIEKNREYYVKKAIKKISQYKVVITDRYHGAIFSLIANTPVVILKSNDHKLESGVKWFPEKFEQRYSFVSNIEDAYLEAIRLMGKELGLIEDYFKTEYYDNLRNKL